MFGSFSYLQFRPCPECGVSVPSAEIDEHVCDPERKLDYQMFQCRDEIGRLESDVVAYLDSAQGRFELWYAERQRRAA
jgi:hypothetical protein